MLVVKPPKIYIHRACLDTRPQRSTTSQLTWMAGTVEVKFITKAAPVVNDVTNIAFAAWL